jgi:hypothetical protein
VPIRKYDRSGVTDTHEHAYTEAMKPFSTVFVLCPCLVFSAWSQTTLPLPQQPLSQVRQFFGLSDAQVSAILRNNNDFNIFSSQQQRQIQNAQSQIAVEIAKDQIDPMAVGTLYAGIENACRELRDKAATSQKQNISILTDAQRAKLNVLNDAIKLAPVISEAQYGNLLGSVGLSPLFFTSSSGGASFGVISGAPFGCSSPGLVIRNGDFGSATFADGNVIQPGRNLGASSDPANKPRLFATPNPWFNTTQPR